MKKHPIAKRRALERLPSNSFELGAYVIVRLIGFKSGRVEALSKVHARKLLKLVMKHVSEERYAAGWLIDLEFVLWQELQKPTRNGLFTFERESLRFLSLAAGGWWTSERFLPMNRWLARYRRHQAKTFGGRFSHRFGIGKRLPADTSRKEAYEH